MAKKKQFTKAMNIKLSPEDHAMLEAAALDCRNSISGVIRALVRAYLRPKLLGSRVAEVLGITAAGIAGKSAEQLELDAQDAQEERER